MDGYFVGESATWAYRCSSLSSAMASIASGEQMDQRKSNCKESVFVLQTHHLLDVKACCLAVNGTFFEAALSSIYDLHTLQVGSASVHNEQHSY